MSFHGQEELVRNAVGGRPVSFVLVNSAVEPASLGTDVVYSYTPLSVQGLLNVGRLLLLWMRLSSSPCAHARRASRARS